MKKNTNTKTQTQARISSLKMKINEFLDKTFCTKTRCEAKLGPVCKTEAPHQTYNRLQKFRLQIVMIRSMWGSIRRCDVTHLAYFAMLMVRKHVLSVVGSVPSNTMLTVIFVLWCVFCGGCVRMLCCVWHVCVLMSVQVRELMGLDFLWAPLLQCLFVQPRYQQAMCGLASDA